jgi:hypothetical protein
MKVEIYQIFYDQKTRESLDSGFIPLDNTYPDESEWFEFLPMLRFLNNSELDEGVWYGFLSPKFTDKVGITSVEISEIIHQNHERANVILLSPEWDQVAYFKNIFEQGEFCHPGLLNLSQKFIESEGINLDLRQQIMDSSNTVFSNYVVAKKEYWDKWKKIAKNFFDYASLHKEYSQRLQGKSYNQYPMKVFIQERLASVILNQFPFSIINIDQSDYAPINTLLFESDDRARELLKKCNWLKAQYRRTRQSIYMQEYWNSRNQIVFKNPSL